MCQICNAINFSFCECLELNYWILYVLKIFRGCYIHIGIFEVNKIRKTTWMHTLIFFKFYLFLFTFVANKYVAGLLQNTRNYCNSEAMAMMQPIFKVLFWDDHIAICIGLWSLFRLTQFNWFPR